MLTFGLLASIIQVRHIEGVMIIVNKATKVLTLVLVAVYVLSPVDLFPGPIDDAIVSLIGAGLVMKRKKDE